MNKKSYFISTDIENLLDTKVYNDVLKTHAKEAITLLDYGLSSITNIRNEDIEKVQFTECEIMPFHHHDIVCTTEQPSIFKRQPSARAFSNQSISFSLLQTLLINAFSVDENGRRPYPSGGGLYPVEPLVFLFPERVISEAPMLSACYHYRSLSKTLQLVKKIRMDYFFDKLLHQLIKPEELPAVCILYVAHVGKTIFKYRYRGYRHAVLEAGSMYQQVIHVSQALGLSSMVWSSFSEHEFLFELGLDHGAFMPLIMQFIGYT